MNLNEALNILHIVKCDHLGYARDLSYTPTRQEIGRAIEVVEEWIASAGKIINDCNRRASNVLSDES